MQVTVKIHGSSERMYECDSLTPLHHWNIICLAHIESTIRASVAFDGYQDHSDCVRRICRIQETQIECSMANKILVIS